MADPRLNSVHLEAPRRAEYRRARESLLQARGSHTVALEQQEEVAAAQHHNTIIQNIPDHAPPDVNFWLMDKEYIYPLRVGINTIGRAPDNDVVVQDAYVSRRHCAVLVHADDGCELHDTASKNGTYLNGRKIGGPTRLHSGDEIRMCDLRLTFVGKSEPPEHPAPTHTLAG